MQLDPIYREVPRLRAGSAESMAHLESQGFVVIADALSLDETTQALDLTWDYLEGLGTGIDRHDPATARPNGSSEPCPM